MSLVTNVFRRGGSYYFRTRVPQRLRALVGRKELWKSLRTKDPLAARQRASLASLLTDQLWRDLERGMSSSSAPLSDHQLEFLIASWLKAELDRDAVLRRTSEVDREAPWHAGAILERTAEGDPDRLVEWLDKPQLEALVDASPKECRKRLGANRYLLVDVNEAHLERGLRHQVYEDSLKRHRNGDTSVAAIHVAELFQREGLDISPESDVFDDAVRLMTRAHRDLLDATRQRDAVLWRPRMDDDPAQDLTSKLRLLAPASLGSSLTSQSEDRTTLQGAVKSLLREARQTDRFKPGRADEYEKATTLFVGWFGRDPKLTEVSKLVAGSFREALTSYPVNAAKRVAYRDLSIPDRIAKARETNDPETLAVQTANGNYLNPLRQIFEWAKATGKVSDNPFAEIKVSGSRSTSRPSGRKDFTLAQLEVFFGAPLFTGAAAASGSKLYQPGTHRVDDWRYWLPLMGLFCGARLNEMCGLRVSDFEVLEGVKCFHIRAGAEHQSLKTKAAERIVPVHKALIDLGLWSRVESLRQSGEDRLFPTLKPGPRGYLSDKPTKFFGLLIDRMLGDEAPLVFHSFRHTFITKMREAGVAREVRTAIVGHEDDSVHEHYGSEPLRRLNEGVQSVDWTKLDLSNVQLLGL